MNKCVKCVFYNVKTSQLTYNLSYCLKFNTFSEFARIDVTKCGPQYRHFREKLKIYNKYSCNF